MPQYLSYSEMQDRLTSGLVADLVDHIDAADREAYVEELIDRAEAKIHGMLGGLYTTPFTDADTVNAAEEWDFAIGTYYLYAGAPTAQIPEKVLYAYEDVCRTLRDIRDGRETLPGEEVSNAEGLSVDLSSETALFDEDSGFWESF